MARPTPRELADDELLVQYGNRWDDDERPFRNRPRFDKPEHDVSAVLGDIPVDVLTRLIRPAFPPNSFDGRRVTTIGRLRAEGFIVTHTPSRKIPHHVSIERDGVWDDEEDRRFDSCWSEPEYLTASESEGGKP